MHPLVELTHTMIAAANDGDWPRLASLTQERHAQLLEQFAEQIPPQASRDAERLILELQSLDRELQGLCDSARKAMVGEMKQLRRGARATRAYGTIASNEAP